MPKKPEKKQPFMPKEYARILAKEEAVRRSKLPHFRSFDEYVAAFPQAEYFRRWITSDGHNKTVFFVQGDGPHSSLPGGYLWAYIGKFRDQPWTVHVGDIDDGHMIKQVAGEFQAMQELELLVGFSPFDMRELTQVGYEWD